MKPKILTLTVAEYKKILETHNLSDTIWGRFEEEAKCVTVPDLINDKVILVFDNDQDAMMFKLRYI